MTKWVDSRPGLNEIDGVIHILHVYRQLILGACAVVAALAFAAPASAQDESATSSVTADQYDPSTERFSGGGGEDPSSVGSLPFTGLDLGLMGGAALTLLAGGVVLHRRANPGDEG
jgi:hypothetical protein